MAIFVGMGRCQSSRPVASVGAKSSTLGAVVARAYVSPSWTVQDDPLGLGETDTEQILDNAYATHDAQVPRSKQSKHSLEIFSLLQPLTRLGDQLVAPLLVTCRE